MNASEPMSTATSLASQLANLRSWNYKYNWAFKEENFRQLEEHIRRSPHTQTPRRARVITASMATIGSTFDAWWQVIADTYEETFQFPEIRSDSEHLRLWGNRSFVSSRLEIVTLDLLARFDPTVEKNVLQTRSPRSADFEILAAVAHFPGWVSGFRQLVINLAGYELSIEGNNEGTSWGFVPTLIWKTKDHPAPPTGLFLGAADIHKMLPSPAQPELLR